MAKKIWNYGKKSGKKVLGLTVAVFGFLLGLIGVSCSFIGMYMPGPVTAYNLKGRVVDSVTGEPVQGIRVTLNNSNGPVDGKSDVTGSSGLFSINSGDQEMLIFELTYSLEDVDPNQYGAYKSATVAVDMDSDTTPNDDVFDSEQEINIEQGTDE